MRTAVDSSVLLDVLGADRRFGTSSRRALRDAFGSGALVACEVVWAEVRACFSSDEEFRRDVSLLGIRFDAISREAAETAGTMWRASRRAARGPRDRMVADFLIGAHAHHQADALLTRDRGFYRACFKELRIIDPSDSPRAR